MHLFLGLSQKHMHTKYAYKGDKYQILYAGTQHRPAALLTAI